MEYIIEKNRIYAKNTAGDLVAEVLFPDKDDKTVLITKTFVDPSLRGQGIAGVLMQKAYDEITRQGKNIEPICSYAVKWMENNA